jgi:hypothetical protein
MSVRGVEGQMMRACILSCVGGLRLYCIVSFGASWRVSGSIFAVAMSLEMRVAKILL